VSWLRIDDGFTRHPKVLKLTRAQRWTWLEVLSYCAEQRTGGVVTVSISNALPTATSAFIEKCAVSGLLDPVEDGVYVVHDWALYNGDLESRVHAYCAKYPHASANDVFKSTGGTRDVVLSMVRAYRKSGTDRTTDPVEIPVRPNHASGTEPGTENGTGPHPHKELPSVSPSRSAVRGTDGLTDLTDEIEEQRAAAARARPDQEADPFA
jgi:hypothetical protein